jgi:hypothetical protein
VPGSPGGIDSCAAVAGTSVAAGSMYTEGRTAASVAAATAFAASPLIGRTHSCSNGRMVVL